MSSGKVGEHDDGSFLASGESADKVTALEDRPAGSPRKGGKSPRAKKHRASVTTGLIGGLQRQDQSMSSWVVGVLYFKSDPGFANLKKVVSERLLAMPRFRSKMVARRFPAATHFVEIPVEELDLDYHFRQLFADRSISDAELDSWLGSMFNEFKHPMEYPLWQMTFIPRLADGRAVLISNVSHVIGDGIAQIEVLMRMLDQPGEEAVKKKASEAKAAKASSGGQVKKRPPPSLGPLTRARVFLGGVWEGLMVVATPPDRKNTLRLDDPTKPSATKRCAFSPTIDLNRLKELKNLYAGATINDVLIALLTMTLRAYAEEVGDKAMLKNKVTAQFPINTRSKKEGPFRNGDPRNKFSYGFMPFHISFKGSPSQLLWKTKRTLDKIKNSPSPLVQEKVSKVIARIMPLKTLNAQLTNVAAKATAQISNVPGPQSTVYMAGTPVDDMRFLLYSPLSFYVGILTYDGKLSCSVCLDSALADPTLIAKHWMTEFERFFASAKEEAKKYPDGVIPRERHCFDCL
jgi:diacylglycerol O-acyltransferase